MGMIRYCLILEVNGIIDTFSLYLSFARLSEPRIYTSMLPLYLISLVTNLPRLSIERRLRTRGFPTIMWVMFSFWAKSTMALTILLLVIIRTLIPNCFARLMFLSRCSCSLAVSLCNVSKFELKHKKRHSNSNLVKPKWSYF